MAKKWVEICDACKEAKELTHSLQIKKGKKGGRSYDICSSCAADLEQRLVADAKPPQAATKSRRTMADLDVGSNDTPKVDPNDEIYQRILSSGHGKQEVPSEQSSPQKTTALTNEDGGCSHANRGRIQNEGKNFFQSCRDCGKRLPYKKSGYTKDELNTKGLDVRVKDA